MSDLYRFTIQDSEVVAKYEWERGYWKQDRIDSDESYRVENGVIYKSEWDDGKSETTVYEDADGDGVYQKSGKQYEDSSYENKYEHDDEGDDSTDEDHDNNTHDDLNDNDASIEDSALSSYLVGSSDSDNFILSYGLDLHVAAFNAAEGDKLVIDTGLGLTDYTELAQYVVSLSYENEVLTVDFGVLGEVELSGIKADQISWDLVDVVS